MKPSLSRILPTKFELASLVFIELLVLVVGNTGDMLSYYGLDSSAQVIKNSAGSAVSSGLAKLDNFSATNNIVLFCIWGLIGLVCFSILQAVARVFQEIRQDEDVASNHFVHPATFNRRQFWQREFLNMLLLIGSVALVAAGVFCFLAYALPLSLAYTREFLLHPSLWHVSALLLGLIITYVWLCAVVVLVKLLIHHRRLIPAQ